MALTPNRWFFQGGATGAWDENDATNYLNWWKDSSGSVPLPMTGEGGGLPVAGNTIWMEGFPSSGPAAPIVFAGVVIPTPAMVVPANVGGPVEFVFNGTTNGGIGGGTFASTIAVNVDATIDASGADTNLADATITVASGKTLTLDKSTNTLTVPTADIVLGQAGHVIVKADVAGDVTVTPTTATASGPQTPFVG